MTSVNTDTADKAFDYCYQRLWNRFIGVHGDAAFVYTYSDLKKPEEGWRDLRPTKEEIESGIPESRIGAKTPLENCCLDNGFYLDFTIGALYPVAQEQEKLKIEKECRLLFNGLLALGKASKKQGFLPRGILTECGSHYPVSAVDQYTTALAGLWRYFHAPFATEEEKIKIVDMLIDIVSMLEADNYYLKFEDGNGYWRGELPRYDVARANRLLTFYAMAKSLVAKCPGHVVQEGGRWDFVYKKLLEENDYIRLKRMII